MFAGTGLRVTRLGTRTRRIPVPVVAGTGTSRVRVRVSPKGPRVDPCYFLEIFDFVEMAIIR